MDLSGTEIFSFGFGSKFKPKNKKRLFFFSIVSCLYHKLGNSYPRQSPGLNFRVLEISEKDSHLQPKPENRRRK